ncbi:ABC transporter permease, partial [Rhizobium ruizarguesonis]
MSYEINQVLPRSFGRLKSSESNISIFASQLRGVLASLLPRYGLLIGFLVFWQVSSTRGWVNPAIFPPLDVILSALWTNLANGALLDDIAISLQRSGTAFAF